MPREPRRHCHAPQPITFSRFSRSAARVAAALNSKACNLRSQSKASSKLLDDGAIKDASRRKKQLSESSDEEVPQEIVQADFEFFDPKPDDFHGVKLLLQTYLDDKEWDLSGFVDLILAQTTVGTVVKVEDDEDNALFAVLTVLNLGRYKDHKSFIELKGYVLEVCQNDRWVSELKVLLEDQAEHVGLLVSQRVTNLPPQLLPHLYNGLFDEISWATEDEPTEDLRKSFHFKYYLLITKIYKRETKSRNGSSSGKDEDIIYLKPEEELLHKLSLWSITFPLQTHHVPTRELENYELMGLVIAIEAGRTSTFLAQLQSLIDES